MIEGGRTVHGARQPVVLLHCLYHLRQQKRLQAFYIMFHDKYMICLLCPNTDCCASWIVAESRCWIHTLTSPSTSCSKWTATSKQTYLDVMQCFLEYYYSIININIVNRVTLYLRCPCYTLHVLPIIKQ